MSPREMSIACFLILLVFTIGVALKASGSRWTLGSETWTLGGDFVELYSAGRVLNDGQADRLYDLNLEAELNRELVPGATELHRAYAYPPFVAILFQPLALLPFSSALAIFLIATPFVFVLALILLSTQFGSNVPDERWLLLLAGTSFFPFIGYTWLGAQISVVGFVAVALALVAEDRQQFFASGLALSLCLYKPSLLVLIVPMLVVSGCWRQLAGLAAGAAVLAALCLAYVGVPGTLAFVDKLTLTIGRAVTTEGLFNAYRYVDLNAFFRLLPYGRSMVGRAALAIVASLSAIALAMTWWRARNGGRAERLLVWACTLAWTLVLNIYMPFYDTLLLVVAAVIAVEATRMRGWRGWNRLSAAILVVYLTPWIAEPIARTLRVQIDTLVIGAFAVLLLFEAGQLKPARYN